MAKVIFSEGVSTVHIRSAPKETFPDGTVYEPHDSKVLLPGESITLEEAPDYMLELVKQGKAPGLVLIDQKEADALVAQANLVKGITAPNNVPEDVTVEETQPDSLIGELDPYFE